MRKVWQSIGLLLVLTAIACERSGATPSGPIETARAKPAKSVGPSAEVPSKPAAVFPNGVVIDLEIAADDATRAQGLMFRESLEPSKGMLFLFPEEGNYPFWMKNTVIPLDILWLRPDGTIVHIESAEPCTGDPCPSYPPRAEALFVLELAKGQAERNGLVVGETLELRNLEHINVR